MKSCVTCQARNINDKEAACPLCGGKNFYDNIASGAPVKPFAPSRAEKLAAPAEISVWTEPIPPAAVLPLLQPALQRTGPRLRQVSATAALAPIGAADTTSFHPPLSSGYLIYPDEGADLQDLENAHLIPLPLGGPDDARNVFPRVKGLAATPPYAALLKSLEGLATQVRTANTSFTKGQLMQSIPAVVRWYLYYHPDGDARIPVWLYAQVYAGSQPQAHFTFPNYAARPAAPKPSEEEARAFEAAHQALGTDGNRGQRIATPLAALQWIHDQYYGSPDAPVPPNPQQAGYLKMRSEQLGGKQPLQIGDLPASHRVEMHKAKVQLLGLPQKPLMACEPLKTGAIPEDLKQLALKHNVWWYNSQTLRSDSFGQNAARWAEPPDAYDTLSPAAKQAAPVIGTIAPENGLKLENLRIHSAAHQDELVKRRPGMPPSAAPDAAAAIKSEVEAMWRRHEAGVRAFYGALPPDLVERWSVFEGLLQSPPAPSAKA